MNDKHIDNRKGNLFSNLLYKLKRIKHLDIILTILFIAIILLIYVSTFSGGNNKTTTNENNTLQSLNTSEEQGQEYSNEVEAKLCKIISGLKDVGKVSVAVTLSGSVEYIYAYTTKVEHLENGTSIETKTPVLVEENNKSTPLILQTIMPKVESVIVIASGAKNTNVKLNILKVVEMMCHLPTSKIEIFVGN